MGNEQGLAHRAAGQPAGMMGQPQETEKEGGMPQNMSREDMMKLVQEIAKLLQQGATEEELVAQGVPEELVDMAMKLVGQRDPDEGKEAQAPAVNNSVGEQGLAQMATQG